MSEVIKDEIESSPVAVDEPKVEKPVATPKPPKAEKPKEDKPKAEKPKPHPKFDKFKS